MILPGTPPTMPNGGTSLFTTVCAATTAPRPVDLVFALVVPEHYTQQHLTLLSHLAEMFSDPACRQRLRQASDDQALFAALSEWQIVNAAA